MVSFPFLGIHLSLFFALFGSFCQAAGFNSLALVEVVPAETRQVAPTIWVAGEVISRQHAQLAAEVAGRLTQIAELGIRLSKGEVVAQIEETSYRLRTTELKYEISEKKVNYQFLQKQTDRLASLAKKNNAAKNRLDQSRADRDVAKHAWQAARVRLALAEDRLAHCRLVAPFSGMVTKHFRQQGERVEVGNPILRLVNVDRLEVQIWSPLYLLSYLAKGKKLPIQVADQQTIGTVRLKIPVGDNSSHLAELRLNYDYSAWSVGQPVRVALPSALPRMALVVPRDALVLRRSGTSLFRINAAQKAEQIKVKTGLGVGAWIEVKGDLQTGDRIVILGNERLRPGQPVQIQDTTVAP